MESYKSRETTFRDYLRIIFRHKIVFIILPLAIMVPIYLVLTLKTPMYEASVKMFVKAQKVTESDYYRGISSYRSMIEDHTVLVMSNTVLNRVVHALKLYQRPIDYEKQYAPKLKTALIEYSNKKLKQLLQEMTTEEKQAFLLEMALNRLSSNLQVIQERDTSFFVIKVRDFNPRAAAIIANTLSRSYVIFDLEQQIVELQLQYGAKHETVVKLKNYVEEFEKTLDGRPLNDLEAIGPASVKIIKQALGSMPVQGLDKNLLLILSFVVSIVLGTILCFLLDYFDQTFRSPQDIEIYLDIPFLGSVSERRFKDKLLISDANPGTTNYTRSYQNLSDRIYLLMKDKNLKAISITDAEASEETPAVIANLGIYLSQNAGHKVLIIDANLRKPSVSKVFDIADNVGLTDVLENKVPLEDAVQDLGSGLYVLPAGETTFNPITLLDSSAMLEVIKTVKEQYDVVFLACADLKNFTDAVILGSITDGIALVVNGGKVRRLVVNGAIAPLKQKKVNIIGAILNNRTYVIPEIIYKLT